MNHHSHKSLHQHVLVWSPEDDSVLVNFAINHLMLEFSEHLYAFSLDVLPQLTENSRGTNSKLSLEEKVALYDFHVIKIGKPECTLLMVNNERCVLDSNSIEEVLEEFGRRISQWKHHLNLIP